MISNKLKRFFLISLLLIYAHGIEEIIGGFQYFDSFMVLGANYFGTAPEIFYWVSHIIFWLSLPILFLLFHKRRVGIILMAIFGVIFIVELHHPIKALFINHYYPGMITALLYPIVGFFFWRQLIKDWHKQTYADRFLSESREAV